MINILYKITKNDLMKLILLLSLNIIGVYVLWVFTTLAFKDASFIGFHRIIIQLAINGIVFSIIHFDD
jgi:hypothetical protein